MGLMADWLRGKRMKDPVRGTAQVVACSRGQRFEFLVRGREFLLVVGQILETHQRESVTRLRDGLQARDQVTAVGATNCDTFQTQRSGGRDQLRGDLRKKIRELRTFDACTIRAQQLLQGRIRMHDLAVAPVQ